MSKNSLEKQKTALSVLGIIIFVLGIGMIAGGAVLLSIGVHDIWVDVDSGWNIAKTVIGSALILLAIGALVLGIRYFFLARGIHATRGSIGVDNSIAKNSVNTKKCPKCGCTNSPDATECSSCHTPLE